jgi:ethanolamine ammonia-lyase large subunit
MVVVASIKLLKVGEPDSVIMANTITDEIRGVVDVVHTANHVIFKFTDVRHGGTSEVAFRADRVLSYYTFFEEEV